MNRLLTVRIRVKPSSSTRSFSPPRPARALGNLHFNRQSSGNQCHCCHCYRGGELPASRIAVDCGGIREYQHRRNDFRDKKEREEDKSQTDDAEESGFHILIPQVTRFPRGVKQKVELSFLFIPLRPRSSAIPAYPPSRSPQTALRRPILSEFPA